MPAFRTCCVFGLFLGMVVSGDVLAQSSHACAVEKEPAARLACYDRAFPPKEGAVSLRTAQERDAAAAQEFGLSRSEREARNETGQPLAEGPKQVEAIVAEVVENKAGQRIVKLQAGQSWLLTEPGMKGHMKAGDQVEIRKATMGTFMLITPGGIRLRAKRVD